MKLCVLVPALDCEHVIAEVCRRVPLPNLTDEIIVVDDASTDATSAVAAAVPRVSVYRNHTRLGYGGTSQRLNELSILHGADVTVNIHGDHAHPPENIPPLLALLGEGYDIVVGSRLLTVKQGLRRRGWLRLFSRDVAAGFSPLRVVGHLSLTAVQNLCYGTNLHSFHEGMRACTRRAVEWMLEQPLPQWYHYDVEMLVRAHRAGLRIGEVAVMPNYLDQVNSAAPPLRYGLRVLSHAIGHGLARWR